MDGATTKTGDPVNQFIFSSGLVQELELYLDDKGGCAKISSALRDVFKCRKVPHKEGDQLMKKMLDKDARFLVENGRVFLNRQQDLPSGNLDAIRFVILDFETTGCGPDSRAMEIGMVILQGGKILDEYGTLLNPDQYVPRFVQKMTGIRRHMLKDAPRFEDVHEKVAAFIEGSVLVAHNLPFDRAFLWREFHRVDGRIPNHPAFCTLALARKLLPKDQKKGVDALCELFDIEADDRHRALGDARATAKILVRLLDLASEHEVETMDDLRGLLDGSKKKED